MNRTLAMSSLIISLGIIALGTGLSTRFDEFTPQSQVLGLQALFSIGAGVGAWQISLTSGFSMSGASNTAPRSWGPSLKMFIDMIGGSIGIFVAQKVFMSQLSATVTASRTDLSAILHGGATNFKTKFSGEAQDVAVTLFNHAITRAFYVSTAASGWSYGIGAALMGLYIILSPCWYFLWRRQKQNMPIQPTALPTFAGRSPTLVYELEGNR